MCRLLGIVASELTEFGLGLTGAPRCLAMLSREHRDGWGIAVHEAEGSREAPWLLHRGTEPAVDDRRFHDLAGECRGHVLVAHVRQKTVGPTRLENTHPFVRDGWVFAHNGTVTDTVGLRAQCNDHRLTEIEGDTDSELLFAYLLSHLDEHGLLRLGDERARERANTLLYDLMSELRAAKIGAFNFLLSDGTTTFAHRFGRSLYVLDRRPTIPPLMTFWTTRREAVLIASERITDEAWREVADGTLLRIERLPTPRIVTPYDAAAQRVAS
jgi:glutamine amidotransferase